VVELTESMRRLEGANSLNQYIGIGSCKAFVAETNVSEAAFVTRCIWNCLGPLVTTRCCRVSLNLRRQKKANKRPKFSISPKDNATGFVLEIADPLFVGECTMAIDTCVLAVERFGCARPIQRLVHPRHFECIFSACMQSPRSMRSFARARRTVTMGKAIVPHGLLPAKLLKRNAS